MSENHKHSSIVGNYFQRISIETNLFEEIS